MRRLFILSTIAALTLMLVAPPAPARAEMSVAVGVSFGPPPLPVYVQPPVPGPNYMWTPGYWAWGPAGYYWVPGTWVLAPQPGLLWTPGYWAYDNDDGLYAWNPGYWAPQVGFYGGIPYGYGYFGVGYVGGGWDGDVFRYNTAVTNVNTTIVRNVYFDRTVVIRNETFNRVSFNGGPGGIHARPTWRDDAIGYFYRHDPPTAAQLRNQRIASANRNYLANVNHGRPAIAAVDRPLSRANGPGFAAIRPHDRIAARQTRTWNTGSTARVRSGAHQSARHTQRSVHQTSTRTKGGMNQTARYRSGGAHPSATYQHAVRSPNYGAYRTNARPGGGQPLYHTQTGHASASGHPQQPSAHGPTANGTSAHGSSGHGHSGG